MIEATHRLTGKPYVRQMLLSGEAAYQSDDTYSWVVAAPVGCTEAHGTVQFADGRRKIMECDLDLSEGFAILAVPHRPLYAWLRYTQEVS